MVWQPLPCDNGKYVWQRYKGEPIVARAASAVTAIHSKSKLVSTNHSLFFHIWCSLSAPEALTAQLRTDSWPCWCCAVQKTQTMLRSAGRQCQLFVIFQMLSWKVFFFFSTLKVFAGRNFEGRTLRFSAFESLFIPEQNLVFLVSHFENFVLRP